MTHPFPYEDKSFAELYKKLLSVLDAADVSIIRDLRRLRGVLSDLDYEYMVWVEWKEGLPDTSRT